MDYPFLARIALSSLCVVQAAATVAIDLNRTHATHPRWPGHARFHVVWQSSTVVLLTLVELAMVWWSGRQAEAGFYIALLLAAVSPAGFLIAFVSRQLFGGTLSDPDGVPQVRLRLLGTVCRVDMNLAAVALAFVALVVIVALYRS